MKAPTKPDRHKIPSYPLRIPEELRAQLEILAEQNRRSLHGEMILRLERSVQAEQKGGAQ